ncbi:uncharacterized protein N7446_010501 [Penicillium canescens]|uniref:P-type ATPase A domain-containing protein n=1 Tax=Penicillium canescens TaxID=5083 RepID=A0AAD6IBK7_PENCN|nr:uncharacterized protein N7446_010501 [Penicillium canescens]KAJ6041619.1 hypothetical protein N7460_007009 [Penicillium canescens]KAJ6050392.1 hypothetical protein N7446_010501 [Penicillium canescens]KAJ6064693.1 hypothetical protein N7444_000346 [Penicillium canescens]
MIFFSLQAAIILAGGLQDWIDFGIICGLLVLNAAIGFIQEYHAGNVVDDLKKSLTIRAQVVLNGALKEIYSAEVVVVDVLHVQDGTIFPADGRLESQNAYLQVDQSGITGESLAVDKHSGDVCYASSAVKCGAGLMIVTATGDHTYVGTAAALVNKASGSPAHFTQMLNGMAHILLIFLVLALLVIWIASYYRSSGILHILEFTLATTVTRVPVGLPVVVTTTMAVGAAYLANLKAIVQKLSAIESLANVEILCSDKTGTLTRNRKTGGIDAIDKEFLRGLGNYPSAKSSGSYMQNHRVYSI